jgi:hypothetical protein
MKTITNKAFCWSDEILSGLVFLGVGQCAGARAVGYTRTGKTPGVRGPFQRKPFRAYLDC